MAPIKYSDISLNDLVVSPLRGAEGKKFGQVTVSEQRKKVKLTFQVPGSILAFEPNQYSSLSVRIADPEFVTFLRNLRGLICEKLELPPTRMVDIGLSESENPNWLPLFRLKVSDETSYYDTDSKRTDMSKVLVKGSEIHIQVQLGCTYLVENRYGISWKALQIVLGKEPQLSPEGSPKSSANSSSSAEENDFLD